MPKVKAKVKAKGKAKAKSLALTKRPALTLQKRRNLERRRRDPRSPTSIMSLGTNNNNKAVHQNECSLIKSACRRHKWSDGRKQPDNKGKYKKCYYAISRGNWSPPHEQNKYYAHPDKGGDIEANQRLNRCIGQESDYGLNSDFVEDEGGELHDGKGISKEERDERKTEFFATIRETNQNISVGHLERLWEEYNSNVRIGQNQKVRFSGTRKRKRGGKGRKRKTRKKVRKRRRRRKKIKTKKRRKRIRKTKKDVNKSYK